MMSAIKIFCIVLLALATASLAAADPAPTALDQRPILRIETGMHTANIWRIGADAQCRLLATGSDDKTVRLWAMPEGRLIRTQRLPVGAGDHGKVYAIAVSPDGSLVAAGGWDAAEETSKVYGLYVFDSATGLSVRHFGAYDNVVFHLAFSPDGQKLAVSLGSGQGVRVIDVASGRELMADREFGGKDSYGVAFAADGSLFAVGSDGQIRVYGPDLHLIARTKAAGGKAPFSVAVDPSGRRIAVGYDGATSVDLYDAHSLRRLGSADTRGVDNGDLSKVAWSADGSRLFAAGQYQADGRYPIRSWTSEGRRIGRDVAVSDNSIQSLVRCGTSVAFGSADPAFGLLDSDRRAVTLGIGHSIDMRSKLGDAFTVSADGMRVRFGSGSGGVRPLLFDVANATLTEAPQPPPDFAVPDITGLDVQDWQDNRKPRFNRQALVLEEYEETHALAVRPDRGGFVIGTEYYVRAYDAAGSEIWKAVGPGGAWGVNLARNGDLVLAAYDDGTVRWYRGSDGKELLALFVNKDTKAWIAWTPTGYYSASPGGEDMIGWHINRGLEQPADFFPADKFRDTFSRPDIVEKILVTLDEDEAVRQANAARPGKAAPSGPITDRLPPVISILSPQDGTNAGESIKIDYIVRSPSGLAVDGVDALIDGRPASTERGLARVAPDQELVQCLGDTHGLGRTEGALQGCRGSVTLTLPAAASTVGLVARAGERTSAVAAIKLVHARALDDGDRLKPKLYALVVGVSAYANKDYALAYAAKDARDFAAAILRQQGGLYSVVDVRLLADGQASASAIRDGLDWLTKQVTSRDVGLVYLAGHGMLDERDRFYYLAADSDAAKLRGTAIPKEDISDALDALAGKALLFLDACHSGAIAGGTRRGLMDINAVVSDFARAERGVVAFTASTGKQVSQEDPTWGNGAFTKAVIEGLGLPGEKAGADYRGDGKITTSELDAYVTERVKVLTGGAQSPVMIRPPTVPDFPFAVAR